MFRAYTVFFLQFIKINSPACIRVTKKKKEKAIYIVKGAQSESKQFPNVIGNKTIRNVIVSKTDFP